MSKTDETSELVAVLDRLNEAQANHFTCWGDLYARLKASARGFTTQPCPETAASAVAVLISFVLALEELPEEGDAVVIAQRLNEIMLTRPDLTGVTFYTKPEATKKELDALAKAIREEALDMSRIDDAVQDADETATPGKYLH